MQLNRVLGRVRMVVRPRRIPMAVLMAPRTHMRLINTRSTNNQHFPNKIESKMERTTWGADKNSSDTSRATGSVGTGHFPGGSGSSGSSGSSSSSGSPSSSSSFPSSSNTTSYSSGSSSNSSGSSMRSSTENNFGNRSTSSSGGGSPQSPSMGRSSSSSSPSSSSSSSSSSSEGFLGSRTVDDRTSPDDARFSAGGKYSAGGGRDRGSSLGEKVSDMADQVSEKVSDAGESLSQTASRMADKVSEKFAGTGKNDQQKYSRENKYSGDTSRSYGETSQPASDYGRATGTNTNTNTTNYNYNYDRSFDDKQNYGGSSSDNGPNLREAASKMSSKISDKVSEGSSAIGQTLHKISDKISETFSGNRSSSEDGGQYRSRDNSYSSSSSSSSPSRSRGSMSRDSSISPFDLSSFFRNNFFGDWGETFSGKALSMKTDIIEHDTEYRVICDLPGVSKKDINISLRKNYLEINGERSEGYDQQGDDHTVHCQERYFGSFTRRLTLPNDAAKDMSGIKAKCDNGVLTVTIPKEQSTSSSSRNRYNVNIE